MCRSCRYAAVQCNFWDSDTSSGVVGQGGLKDLEDLMGIRPAGWVPIKASENQITYSLRALFRHLQSTIYHMDSASQVCHPIRRVCIQNIHMS